MPEEREGSWLDAAEQRLLEAERAGDEERLSLLEELHDALERELDADQAAPPGR